MVLKRLRQIAARLCDRWRRPTNWMTKIERVALDVRQDLRTPALNVLLPRLQLADMTGGPNTILQIVVRAAAGGVPVRLLSIFDDPDADLTPLRDHLSSLTGIDCAPLNISVSDSRPGRDRFGIGPNDVFCATSWPTAHVARKAADLTRRERFAYIIQDFEPAFFPWSSDYALALETYSMNILPIVNEETLRDFLVNQQVGRFADPKFVARALSFMPAVDRSKFYPEEPKEDRPHRLLFYARPSHKRFLYDIALKALRRAIANGTFHSSHWEFFSMGEKIRHVDLGINYKLVNKPWLAYDEYACQMRSADIVLALTLSPHTSYPPIEAAACGAVVVTNTFATKTDTKLSSLSPDIVWGEPAPDSIANALAQAESLVSAGGCRRDGLTLPADWGTALAQSAVALRALVDT